MWSVSVADHRVMTPERVAVGGGRWISARRGVPRSASARVRCRDHGVIVAAVPWARHRAGHTRDFDDLAAWLAVRTSKSAVMELLRVAWRTVGSIVTRVNADIDATIDRLEGLRRIGIDEISYKRGHRYLIVVVDHDSGRLVWAGPGRNDTALHVFFDELGPERSALLTHVSADMADWIARVVARRHRTRCAAPIRSMSSRGRSKRSTSNDAERGTKPKVVAPPARSAADGHARPATPNTSPSPATRCGRTPVTSPAANATNSTGSPRPTTRLWRAYLLKEGLRYVFAVKGDEGKVALDRWIEWARRSRIPAFVHLQRRIVTHRAAIDIALDTGLSQGLVESTNTKIRLLTRIAFGFHGYQPLIALAMLALGAHPPRLPGRN